MRLKRIGILALLTIVPLFGQDWAGLQNTLIKFYRYQRSGLAPTTANPTGNPYNPFYTTTGTGNDANHYPHWSDGGSTPLDGGFYDAGDFMKFGLPLGFSVYCLLKGYDVFTDPACYDDLNSWNALGTKDNIPDILNEAKVGTDYINKAVISSTQIVQTVGNGPTDHGALTESGYANSLRTEPRPVSYCAGGDVPGFYAAALALMSILYKPYDAAYSATCLSKAQLAYTFAVAHPSICVEQTDPSTGAPFYVSATYQDKLACAAIELYRATKTASYLAAAKTYFSTVSQPHYDVLGYAHCSDLAAFELFRSGDSTTKSSAEGSLLANVSTELSRVVKAGTPYVGGATVNTTNWGTCRTVGNAAFTAAMLYMIDGDVGMKNFAIQQVEWLAGLGSFSRSWITQYGTNFPQNPHSRNDINLRPARLTGGVVSGPTADNCTGTDKSMCSWSFTDQNSIYKNTECALDYGCGAIGAVAFIRWANKVTDTIRIDSALAPTPAKLDLTSQTETITATLSQSTSWTVILKGQTSNATKTYTGTGTKVLIQNWKGDIDAGSNAFTAERVSVYFDTTKMKIWNVQKSTSGSTYFDIINLQVTAWGAKDIAVDDFEDTALLTNLLGGKWSGFSDLSDGISGGQSSEPVIFSDSGRNSAKGLYFTLSRNAGATAQGAPYAGIKTTFTALGTPVIIGSADTIMFDLKPLGTNSVLWVQLEQSDVTDGAYFGSTLQLGSAGNWVRLYVPIASLTQPAWKTTAKALNLKKAVSVRFVGYGLGSDRYVIDNLRISNLSITASVLRAQSKPSAARSMNPVEFYSVSPTALTYGIFFKGIEGAVIAADLFDCLGKSVFSYKINGYKTGTAITVSGFSLHAGIYFLKHTVVGTNKSVIAPFMVTK
jgi:hypothetical protein